MKNLNYYFFSISVYSVESFELIRVLYHVNVAFLVTKIFFFSLKALEFRSHYLYSGDFLLLLWSESNFQKYPKQEIH